MIWLLAFIGIPIAEIYFLVVLSSHIGFGPTLAIVILTGVVGIACIKHQGRQVMFRVNRELEQGKLPAGPMTEGLLLLAAGLLLITPGIFTDAIGFVLLVPPVRRLTAWLLGKHFAKRIRFVHYPGAPGPTRAGDGVIEGDWEEED